MNELMRRRLSVAVTLCSAALAAIAMLVHAPAASAAELSPGCQALNDPIHDGLGLLESTDPALFAAGETVTVSAVAPASANELGLAIRQAGAVVFSATAPLPGTLTYTFPTSGVYSVHWTGGARFPGGGGTPAAATFVVSCAGATPSEHVEDVRTLVGSLALHEGTTQSLESKLDEALAAIEAGDVETACGALRAFLNHVRAQTGKKLTASQAEQLTEAVSKLRDELGCT